MSDNLKKDILKAAEQEKEVKNSLPSNKEVVDFGKPQREFFEYKGEKKNFGAPKVFIAEQTPKKDPSSD